MRKLIVTQFITLDGVIESPHLWSFPYFTKEITQFKHQELFDSGVQLFGRVTYDAFAESWPSQTDEYASRINDMPKYAVSTTLQRTKWNNSFIIHQNIEMEIMALKEQTGQDILVHGSATLVKSLIKADLIDQYNLLVFPLVLGKGLRLFEKNDDFKLKLKEKKAFSSGVVLLTYQPNGRIRS